MKTEPDQWSQILTELRQEAGLSQRQAAIQAGLSPNYVRHLEMYGVSPSVQNLDKVLAVYGYELEVVKR
tara:strand:- start:1000 stop:1206 length:207 start_codon:yes stop_codon:yes gene_type:complete